MHRGLLIVLLAASLVASSRSYAQNAGDIFGTILNELGRQIDKNQRRKQQKKITKQLNYLWNACDKGDIVACDQALNFSLSGSDRMRLQKMRNIAVLKPKFEKDLYACQHKRIIRACESALNYPYISNSDRSSLLIWRDQAEALLEQRRREQAQAEQRRREQAQAEQRRREQARAEQRRREQARAEQRRHDIHERRLREANTKALRDAFLTFYRSCHQSYDLQACEIALRHESARPDEIRKLSERKRQISATSRQPAASGLVSSTKASPNSTIFLGAVAAVLAITLAYVLLLQWRPGIFGEIRNMRAKPAERTVAAQGLSLELKAEKRASGEKVMGRIAHENMGTMQSKNAASDLKESFSAAQAASGCNETTESITPAESSVGAAHEDKERTESQEVAPNEQKWSAPLYKAVSHPAVFVIAYVVLMLPTYVLPFLGSNSSLMHVATGVAYGGPNPFFLVHFACLSLLAWLAWIRGIQVDRKWLIVFPLLAMAFDLVPFLNFIPLVTTVMHLLAVILGVAGTAAVAPRKQVIGAMDDDR